LKPARAQADRAPSEDRLMLLVLPGADLAWRLRREIAPWINNLPTDVEFVSSRLDVDRSAVVFAMRSKTFPRIARGAPIPEFSPRFNGLLWRRR
jgi:hypothetical protein